MPTLIVLNGPPGIGKSTLASRYIDEHPGTLNLDIDRLHPLIGGWRDDTRTHDILRPLALAMAATHLHGGRDVIAPNCITMPSRIEEFEQVAQRAGGRFIEVVLMAPRADAIARFADRTDDSEWGRHNRELVPRLGGERWLGELYDRFEPYLAQRSTPVITSVEGAEDETYRHLEQLLARP